MNAEDRIARYSDALSDNDQPVISCVSTWQELKFGWSVSYRNNPREKVGKHSVIVPVCVTLSLTLKSLQS